MGLSKQAASIGSLCSACESGPLSVICQRQPSLMTPPHGWTLTPRLDRSLDFKAAIRALGGTVSTSAVRRAAKQMDSIPSEFTKLLAGCSGESRRSSKSAPHDA